MTIWNMMQSMGGFLFLTGIYNMDIKILENKATWELKMMVSALQQGPISDFLNDDDDKLRLKNAKKVLKDRKNGGK